MNENNSNYFFCFAIKNTGRNVPKTFLIKKTLRALHNCTDYNGTMAGEYQLIVKLSPRRAATLSATPLLKLKRSTGVTGALHF